jgi:hypothetical protein
MKISSVSWDVGDCDENENVQEDRREVANHSRDFVGNQNHQDVHLGENF